MHLRSLSVAVGWKPTSGSVPGTWSPGRRAHTVLPFGDCPPISAPTTLVVERISGSLIDLADFRRRTAVRFTALSRQNLELLLDLFEPCSHALLVEVPEIAPQHIVGLSQLIEMLGKGAGAIPHIPIHLGDA